MFSDVCRGAEGGLRLYAAAETPGTDLYAVHCPSCPVGTREGKGGRAGEKAVSGLRNPDAAAEENGGERLDQPLPLPAGRAGRLCLRDGKGWALREKVREIPWQVGKCITLPEEDAKQLYTLLHKLLDTICDEN